jgi:hypothetical protein
MLHLENVYVGKSGTENLLERMNKTIFSSVWWRSVVVSPETAASIAQYRTHF